MTPAGRIGSDCAIGGNDTPRRSRRRQINEPTTESIREASQGIHASSQGLLVVGPAYVEGFLPAHSRRRREPRAGWQKLAPLAQSVQPKHLKLQAAPSSIAVVGRRDQPLEATGKDIVTDVCPTTSQRPKTSGEMEHAKMRSGSSRRVTTFLPSRRRVWTAPERSKDTTGDDGASSERNEAFERVTDSSISTMSLDILSAQWGDQDSFMERFTSATTAAADIPQMSEAHNRQREGTATSSCSNKQCGNAMMDSQVQTTTDNAKYNKPMNPVGQTEPGSRLGVDNAPHLKRKRLSGKGRGQQCGAIAVSEETRGGVYGLGDGVSGKGEVLRMALPGEPTGGTAAACAVVLASGPFRHLASMHVNGRAIATRVPVPWIPPLKCPFSSSHSEVNEAKNAATRQRDENDRALCAAPPTLDVSLTQAFDDQPSERGHPKRQIQRAWRGFFTRREFWGEFGIGLHALAVRIQRIYQGWRGKIRAARHLEEIRSDAAAVITALGRGFQGRGEARQLRVNRHNRAAETIQTHLRARTARRWMESIALHAHIQATIAIQSIWRGLTARRRFRVLGLRLILEENAIEEITAHYAEHPTSGQGHTSGPTLPEGFQDRFLQHVGAGGFFEGLLSSSFPNSVSAPFGACGRGTNDQHIDGNKSNGSHSVASSCEADKTEIILACATATSSDDLGGGGVENSCSVKEHDTNVVADKSRSGGLSQAKAPEISCRALPSLLGSGHTFPEILFVAYGHCLVAGTGTITSSLGTSGTIPKTLKTRRLGGRSRIHNMYTGALRVFGEGLRRFPKSAGLLYGASLAMQASWFSDGRGASPTPAMLETAFDLLGQAWTEDPDRREYRQVEVFLLAGERRARRILQEAEAQARLPDEAAGGVEAEEGNEPHPNCSTVVALGHHSQELRPANRIARKNVPDTSMRKTHASGKDAGGNRQGGPNRHGDGFTAPGGSKNTRIDDEQDYVEENPTVVACKKASARGLLHLALWSQMACGNFEMDLRRKETRMAYKRVARLYSKALWLDSRVALPEITESERLFSAFFLTKTRQLGTRPIRVKVPAHPADGSPDNMETTSKNDEYNSSRRQGVATDQQRHQMRQQQPQRLISPDVTQTKGALLAESVATNRDVTARVAVTAWRNRKHLLLRTTERLDSVGTGSSAVRVDVDPSIGAVAHIGGGGDANNIVDGSATAERTSEKLAQEGRCCRAGGNLLVEGGSVIVIHENEMDRLAATAIELQVAEGRPRELVENQESFRLVVDQFMGKVVLKPSWKGDMRFRYSGYDCGETFSRGRYVAVLPILEAMREKDAEQSARDDGARVLQRAFGGFLARRKCRSVCYELMEIISEQREHGRRLLEQDVLRQREADAASMLQSTWKGAQLRRYYVALKGAAVKVQRCFGRLKARQAAAKAERRRLEGPEVLTVYKQGVVVSGIPLMLSVMRCGFSFKFVGQDQEACWAHHGYCYEFEVYDIIRRHNDAYGAGNCEGDRRMPGRPLLVDSRQQNKVVAMLISRLALVDALPAPTTELHAQHRYKTIVVDTTDLDRNNSSSMATSSSHVYALSAQRRRPQSEGQQQILGTGLRGPGILACGAERGRGLRDTRATVESSYKRFVKREKKWEEARRRQAYMEHHDTQRYNERKDN